MDRAFPAMTPEQWARVKEVFAAALEEEPDKRRAHVAAAAAGDDAVRAEVERLLDAQRQSTDFMEQPAGATLVSGRMIGHYEIGRLVGSGGMGHVFAARDVELGREVAVKVASLQGEDAQTRLRREAQHASRLSHPHICHIYEVGRADGQLYVVMELVPGRALADVLRDGPLPVEQARRYGIQIADALAHAHESGLVHRDLKSSNVMITPKQGAKVLDFGLARLVDTHQIDALSQSQRSLTDAGLIAGTLPYMAPELLRGQRGDERADIWALGVLLYEMFSGRRPFSGATGFELSAAILHQTPEAWPPGVSTPVRAIVQRCLAKTAGERYQHASDVRLALEEMRAPAPSTEPTIPEVPRRRRASVRWLVIALAIAAIVVYGVSTRVGNALSNTRGYSLLGTGAFDQAIEQFEGVTKQSPNDANAWDSLGEGYLANAMPERALESYGRALAIEPAFDASRLGRGLALAALGRYGEALDRQLPDFRTQAFLLSRVGRYREAMDLLEGGRGDDGDPEITAGAWLTSAWLLVEQKEYARAIDAVQAAEKALGDQRHPLLVLAGLMGGVAVIRAGDTKNAMPHLTSQRLRHDSDDLVESNWIALLEGEIALAEGQHDRAMERFKARQPAWQTMGRDAWTVFVVSPPLLDGPARVEVARGNRAAAIEEYRRLTSVGAARGSSAALEPRYVLELARLLSAHGDRAGARAEYERFLKFWANADAGLPEIAEAQRAVAAP